MNKIIYYYQTFIGLQSILNNPIKTTHIIVSSIHFGKDKNDKLYIHLNDYPPQNKKFNQLWIDLKKVYDKGITIMLMIGGAGGAYSTWFENEETYKKGLQLLKNIISNNSFIKGIDLDIEENVSLLNVQKVIRDLKTIYGKQFIITMAPVCNSLMYNYPGLGGFIYKDLMNTDEGKMIDWFNGQFYFQYSKDMFEQCVKNDYNPSNIIFGMISSNFVNNFDKALEEIKKVKQEYPNFGGVYIWEYCNSPPDNKNPCIWSQEISKILH